MKSAPPDYNGIPPSAPPSYAQAVGGLPHANSYVYHHPFQPGPQILTVLVPVGPNATHMICPHCHAEIDTTTRNAPGLIAYIAGAILCLIGCFCGCCLIPCCIDSCMDVHHTCPNCKAYLGRFRK